MQKFTRPKAVLAIAFGPDGKVITGDSEGTVFVWSTALAGTIEVTSALSQVHTVSRDPSRHSDC